MTMKTKNIPFFAEKGFELTNEPLKINTKYGFIIIEKGSEYQHVSNYRVENQPLEFCRFSVDAMEEIKLLVDCLFVQPSFQYPFPKDKEGEENMCVLYHHKNSTDACVVKVLMYKFDRDKYDARDIIERESRIHSIQVTAEFLRKEGIPFSMY